MRGWWAAFCFGCSGAADPSAARRAWLVDVLADDNRVWEGRWDELADKYAAMADDPFDFVRGTLGVFLRDVERPGTGRAPTAFLTRPESAAVLLVGDPHPENLGTYLPGEGPGPTEGPVPLRLEWNDFDGAAFGPWILDVRRAIAGQSALLDGAGADRETVALAARDFAEGYLDALDHEPAAVADPLTSSLPVAHLVTDASEEGLRREQLLEATELVTGGRRFRAGGDLVGLDLEQRAQVERLLAAYGGPAGFRVLDVGRRLGAGITSLPALRYVVVWDRGDGGPDDDELLQLREVVDPPAWPGRTLPTFDDGADRVLAAPRQLWSRPDADVRLAGLVDGAQVFKVQTWSSFHESLDHHEAAQDLAAGRPSDASGFARELGAALGGAHGRSVTADGGPARDTILAEVDGRRDAFVAERVRDALPDLDRALGDHLLFQSALDEFGPLLGAYGR